MSALPPRNTTVVHLLYQGTEMLLHKQCRFLKFIGGIIQAWLYAIEILSSSHCNVNTFMRYLCLWAIYVYEWQRNRRVSVDLVFRVVPDKKKNLSLSEPGHCLWRRFLLPCFPYSCDFLSVLFFLEKHIKLKFALGFSLFSSHIKTFSLFRIWYQLLC